ncbi:YigZ family protein [Tissierella creatinini]|nr:YigZ family protein [Tissierella creatinini]TJX67140.1 YigZ family protein [Soehngenia saccharolytica]
MKDIYRTVKEYGQDETIINKSKFIGYASPIDSEEGALEFIEMIKTKHKDATHNVYAYVYGEDSNIQRFSDDGEPSGTAGIPVLQVIKKEDLRNVVVVVTRYFGGIKLGGGGLIRAYTKSAKIGLDAGEIVDMTIHTKLRIIVDYTLFGKFENFLSNSGYKAEDMIYKEKVEIHIYVMKSKLDDFIKDVMNLTNGTAEVISLYEKHLPARNGLRIY